ncbi:hypothetical protein H8356DRAFT_1736835 [Neocallimastix lanati (nom. inval.)]|nr:hypothetical protein H8356DRAFT_1760027 [Neocallimastix sp. JGI-2020a]KAG4086063.1 hypothetical protein H8356DRAFT_1736835 [Neocallimastix sp. JGI-2020a]
MKYSQKPSMKMIVKKIISSLLLKEYLMYFREEEIRNLVHIIKKKKKNYFKEVDVFAEIMHTLPSKFNKIS